jgi:predicted dehydrogenase
MKTRIGFIGAGGIANRHIGNLLTFDDVTVVAVADPQRDRAEAAAARVGARVYNGHDPMLESETLHGVYICTPPFAHGPPEIACVTHKVPFFR